MSRDDYDYDGLYRLDYVARSNLQADKQQGAYTHDFNYDLHGNLETNLGLTSMDYTGNQLDRIELKNGSSADYVYDANGNMHRPSCGHPTKRRKSNGARCYWRVTR